MSFQEESCERSLGLLKPKVLPPCSCGKGGRVVDGLGGSKRWRVEVKARGQTNCYCYRYHIFSPHCFWAQKIAPGDSLVSYEYTRLLRNPPTSILLYEALYFCVWLSCFLRLLFNIWLSPQSYDIYIYVFIGSWYYSLQEKEKTTLEKNTLLMKNELLLSELSDLQIKKSKWLEELKYTV